VWNKLDIISVPLCSGFGRYHGMLARYVSIVTTFRFRCFINEFYSTPVLYNLFLAWQTEQNKGAILKHSGNVEKMIQQNRQNVAWALSGYWWLEINEKWIWSVSSEMWVEAAGRFWNITVTLRANIDVSIWRCLSHYLHTPRPVN